MATHGNAKPDAIRQQWDNKTHWEPADQEFRSQYGPTSYRAWCLLEARRLGGGYELAEDGNGNCCIGMKIT